VHDSAARRRLLAGLRAYRCGRSFRLLTVASQPLARPVRLDTAFVPAYRCGAALDSHQVPFWSHIGGNQQCHQYTAGQFGDSTTSCSLRPPELRRMLRPGNWLPVAVPLVTNVMKKSHDLAIVMELKGDL
jgi:hypothetical protein